MTAEADEAASSYAEELEELTFNSKPIINSLTMIAEELIGFCPAIVSVIEKKIRSTSSDKKLPLMYLLDSICKNVGGVYISQFSLTLPALVGSTYDACGPKVRNSLQALIKTWNGVFPPVTVEQVVARVTASGANLSAPHSRTPAPSVQMQPHAPPPPPPPPIVEPQGGHTMQLKPIMPGEMDGGFGAGKGAGRMGDHGGRKRAREDRKGRGRNPGAPLAALRAELNGLMQQLRACAQPGGRMCSPAQWNTMGSQAGSLCMQLMDQEHGSNELAVLQNIQRELQQMQVAPRLPQDKTHLANARRKRMIVRLPARPRG